MTYQTEAEEMENASLDEQEAGDQDTDSFIRDIIHSFKQNRLALIGLAVVVALIFIAVFAPFITPHDPYRVSLDDQLLPPSSTYWLGTDKVGRDLLTRIIYGTRVSLSVGLVPSFFSMVIGTILGLSADIPAAKPTSPSCGWPIP